MSFFARAEWICGNICHVEKFVISTEIYRHRLEKFLLSNPSLKDLSVKMGINARSLGANPLQNPQLKSYIKQPCSWKLGAICCAIAHLEIMQKVADDKKSVTVFEDDAILINDFENVSQRLIEQLPLEWDLVQWGFNWDAFMWMRLYPNNGPLVKIDLCNKEDALNIDAFRQMTVNSALFPVELSFGMHAYSISPSGATKILDSFEGFSDKLIVKDDLGLAFESISLDCDLNARYPLMNSYIAFPPLSFVYNQKSESAIWNDQWSESSFS